MGGGRRRQPGERTVWQALLFDTGEDGTRRVSPFLPVLAGLALLLVGVFFVVGRCAAGTVTSVTGGGEQPVPTVATPSFTPYQPSGCASADAGTLAAVDDALTNRRMQAAESAQTAYRGGQFVVVRIRWDNRMVEDRATFYVDRDNKLWAISQPARALTSLPDGRDANQVTAVTEEALAAENCPDLK